MYKNGLRTERIKIIILTVDSGNIGNIGIQMKRKELTKTFMMISIWKIHSSLHDLYENISKW